MKVTSSFIVLSSLGSIVTGVCQEARQPNIVFILVDDMGWKDLGVYGNRFIETPHIDSLAQNGIQFTRAYAASPVSSPTRASIMTGKHPARLHLTNFINGTRTDSLSPVLPAQWKPYLETEEITIAEILKTKGYTSGMVGKWHLGNDNSMAPWNQGFDYTRMIGKNALDYYNYSIFLDSYEDEFFDRGTEYLTDKLTEYGMEFIKKKKDEPFFLYLSYSAPHVFIVPRADKLSKYLLKYAKGNEEYNPSYAAVVESIDDGVGQIVKTLREQELLDNTLIIFTSDNGGLAMNELGPTPTTNAPLREMKGHVYEGGIRVPAIMSWKGKIQYGQVSDYYFSTTDYLPTFCELLGITDFPQQVDGESILHALFEPRKKTDANRPLFWHYPHFSNQMGRPAGAVRVGNYKLIEKYESKQLELYDLELDVSESVNLSDNMKQKTNELHQLLLNWRESVNAQMPLPNPDYKNFRSTDQTD